MDRVIDYTAHSVLDAGETFDVVFDTVSTTPLRQVRTIMAPAGVYMPVGGLGKGLFGLVIPLVASMIDGMFVSQRTMPFTAGMRGADLHEAAAWCDAGTLTPVIDAVYPLAHYADALAQLEGQHVAGIVVLRVR